MTVSKVLFLTFETSGVAYCIHVNGIKVAADRKEVQTSNAFPINQWLQPGQNKIALNLSIPYEQDEYRDEKKAVVKVIEPGEGDDPETVFAELTWTENQGQDFPIDLSAYFQIENEFPKPFWMDADLLSEDAFASAEIRSTLNELHHCLSNRNLNDFQNLFQVKTKEMARAYGMDEADRIQGQTEFMERFFQDPKWAMEPLPANPFFELQAENRLLTVSKPNGASILQSSELSEGLTFGIELYLSRKAGQWTVCR